MKLQKTALLTISSLALALSSLANADVTVYGKANVSLNTDTDKTNGTTDNDTWTLNSNASRLGVKGDMELEDGLKAIYQLEYEVALDDGSASSTDIDADCDDNDATTGETCETVDTAFKQRNIFVGLEGDFGQVILGKFDTPLKASQGKVDRFNDLSLGDIKEVLAGENRESNLIQYTTPEFSNMELAVALQPGEQDGQTPTTDKNGPADGISASLTYSVDNFWIAAAMDSEIDDMDVTRVTAEYTLNKLKLAAMIQNAEDVDGVVESSGYLVSTEYGLNDKWKLKAQYSANTDEETTVDDVDTNMASIGADYKLAKKAKLYVYASNFSTDDGTDEEKSSTVGFGTEVKF